MWDESGGDGLFIGVTTECIIQTLQNLSQICVLNGHPADFFRDGILQGDVDPGAVLF